MKVIKIMMRSMVFIFIALGIMTGKAYAFVDFCFCESPGCCAKPHHKYHRSHHHRHHYKHSSYNLSITTIVPLSECGDVWASQYDTLASSTCDGCADLSVYSAQPDTYDYSGCNGDSYLSPNSDFVNNDYDMAD